MLTVKGASYTIPAQTFIQVNNHAAQVNPDTWGKDANDWQPERWIESSRSGSDSDETFDAPPNRIANEGNDLGVAIMKYRMAAYMWQAYTADQMRRKEK